jgi:hypothetical protein
MSIVDELVANLVQRNAVRLNGTLRISLIDGGVSVNGTVVAVLRDQSKNKDIFTANAPVAATVRVGDLVIPVPKIP